jgi:hypothetical protein
MEGNQLHLFVLRGLKRIGVGGWFDETLNGPVVAQFHVHFTEDPQSLTRLRKGGDGRQRK